MPTTLQSVCRSRSLRFLARFDLSGRETLQEANGEIGLRICTIRDVVRRGGKARGEERQRRGRGGAEGRRELPRVTAGLRLPTAGSMPREARVTRGSSPPLLCAPCVSLFSARSAPSARFHQENLKIGTTDRLGSLWSASSTL